MGVRKRSGNAAPRAKRGGKEPPYNKKQSNDARSKLHDNGNSHNVIRGSNKAEPMGKNKGETPRNNQKQNRQAKDVGNKLGLNNNQRRELHDEISGKGWGHKKSSKRQEKCSMANPKKVNHGEENE
jgi:hypothetical protein